MVRNKKLYSILQFFIICIVLISLCPIKVFATAVSSGSITYSESGNIQIDGNGNDWNNYTLLSSNDSNCKGWTVVKDGDTYYFYILGNNAIPKNLSITYEDGTQGNSNLIQLTWDNSEIKNGWYGDIDGASIVKSDTMVEFAIPANYFANQDFSISYCGSSIDSKDIMEINENNKNNGSNDSETSTDSSTETTEQPVYTGIVIDGEFSDWDAVQKNEVSNEAINSAAMVFDGDWVYIYLSAPLNYSASNAGSHGNGKYQLKTDLGNTLLFQINLDGSVSGVENIQSSHSDLTWGLNEYYYEIAIPKRALPNYLETISFGLYLGEDFVSNVANLQEDNDSNKAFDGITYDGDYDDWDYYPHTVIQYATAGTGELVQDAEGALYSEGKTLYGHVITTMPAHLEEAGGEFSSAVTIQLNEEHNFYPRLVAVDAAGNINWNPQLQGLSKGDYEFYFVDSQGWATATNLTELQQQGNDLYGKIHMSIGSSSDEMEFEMDIEALARKFNMDPNDIKTLSAQFGRIGQQWIQTAGTSTGAYIGIGICLAVVFVTLKYRKRKEEPIHL